MLEPPSLRRTLAMCGFLVALTGVSSPWSGAAVAQTAGHIVTGAPHYYQPATPTRPRTMQCDVCIYGGTSAGVAAALQLGRSGHTAIILEPSQHMGGMSAGGLSDTDIGNKAAIGGIAREFYRRCGQKYGVAEEWRFEPHVAEAVFHDMVAEAKTPVYYGQFLKSVEKQNGHLSSLTLESGLTVRAKIFMDATYEGDLMAKAGVRYSVGREANSVYGETLNGVQVQKGHQFELPVDPYRIAGEPASGVLPGISPKPADPTGTGDTLIQAYNFRLCLTDDPTNQIPFEKPQGYDPQQYVLLARYLQAGWPESEVFRKFDPIQNSHLEQNALTPTLFQPSDLKDEGRFLAKFQKAEGPLTRYLKDQFSPELRAQLDAYEGKDAPSPALQTAFIAELNRALQGPLLYSNERFAKVTLSAATRTLVAQNLQGAALLSLNRRLVEEAYPNSLGPRTYLKVDKNNHGAFSTDYIGGSYAYPEADYATREKIFQAHVTYQQGLMWFMGHDPAVPEKIRQRWNTWGLAKDEFSATGGWPHQLYVREARRMISDYVMTERNCVGKEVVPDAVGLAAYTMDSHNCQRFVQDGRVWNEGNVQVQGFPPYPISYRAIVPRRAECDNLVVPVCLAASHIAYGSIRMEPVFMILGQSAATAAHLALERSCALQAIPYPALKTALETEQQILSWHTATAQHPTPTAPATLAVLSGFFARLRAGQKQTVVAYGTSLTHNGAWTTLLKNWLDNQYPGLVTFYNSGLSGKNSDEGVAQLQTQVLDHHPDLVLIEFAMNDAHVKFNMPVTKGAQNLDTMVSAIRAQNPETAVVLQVMSVPWDAPNGNRSFSDRPQLEAFYENYRVYARTHTLPIVDHLPNWQRLKEAQPDLYHSYLSDGLHPNHAGDEAINWPSLRALLEQARDIG